MALLTSSIPRSALVLCLTALGAIGSQLWAENVEVVFTNGERVYGELLGQNASEVDITRIVYTRSRVITSQASYPATSVKAVIPVPSLIDYYRSRAKDTPDTYADQYALARWCFERGLQDQAFNHAKHLYDQDPTDDSSKSLLKEIGYVLDDGQWVKEGAYASKHGLVTFDGHLMTPAQVELRRTDLKAQLLFNNGTEHSLTLANAIVSDQRRITQQQQRMTALDKAITDDKAQNQAATQGGGQGQGGRTNRQIQAQQQQAADPGADDSEALAQKQDIQKAIDNARKQLQTDQKAQADFVSVLAKLQSDELSAHQAFVATLPQAEQDQDAARLKAQARSVSATSAAPAAAPADKKAPAKDADDNK